jgi:hypothetical protein
MKSLYLFLSVILLSLSGFEGIMENYSCAIWEICLSSYCLAVGGYIKNL